MGINSRSKGARNERRIAELFTQWTGRKFAKTPASGGLHWKASFVHGDIICTKEGHYFPFCIEAKSYSKIDFSHLLNPKIKNIDILDFWEQCYRDAKECNKVPLLFMRYDGLPKDFYFVVMQQSYFNYMPMFYRALMRVNLKYWNMDTDKRLIIVRSTEFLKTDYKIIKDNAKSYIKRKPKT